MFSFQTEAVLERHILTVVTLRAVWEWRLGSEPKSSAIIHCIQSIPQCFVHLIKSIGNALTVKEDESQVALHRTAAGAYRAIPNHSLYGFPESRRCFC